MKINLKTKKSKFTGLKVGDIVRIRFIDGFYSKVSDPRFEEHGEYELANIAAPWFKADKVGAYNGWGSLKLDPSTGMCTKDNGLAVMQLIKVN